MNKGVCHSRDLLLLPKQLPTAQHFRLFSCIPVSSGRETRLGYDRPRPRFRRSPAKFPASTAYRYYPPGSVVKSGQSSTTPAENHDGPKRSFIFDLPDLLPLQPGFENFRDLRLRMFHEQIRGERTLKREMQDARWFADPWYRMKKTPPRACIVTRHRLPNAFLICFKPVHRANEQDNPPALSSQAAEADTSNSEDEPDDPSPRDKHTGLYTHPSAFLVPHNVLHPKFAPARGGRSVYVTARRDVVEEMMAREGSHTPELLRLARSLHFPPLLPDMIQSQLERRVVQELELLFDRVRGTAADPQGKIRSSHQPSTKNLDTQSRIVPVEDIPLNTKSVTLDPSWMLGINGDRLLLRRLTMEQDRQVKDGEGFKESDTFALLDMDGLDATLAQDGEGSTPTGPAEVSSAASLVADKTSTDPEARPVIMIPGPTSEIPLFRLSTLLRRALHDEIRTVLGAILGIETMIKTRSDAAREMQQSLIDDANPQNSDPERPPAPETKSNLLALNSWAAPKDLTGRRGDSAVPLFIALHRLRLWHGDGWSQRLVTQRGHEV